MAITVSRRTLSVHREHELLLKLETAGLTDELAQLVIGSRKNQLAKQIVTMIGGQDATEGEAKPEAVDPVSLFISTSANPFVPPGWQVEEHQTGAEFEWNPSKISFYLSEQQEGKVIRGHELRKELQGKPVLNANVLDWLLANPQHIPAEWKGKWIFFWGTIYRDPSGNLFVRCLDWDGGQWDWYCCWLGDVWGADRPAAVFAS